MKNKDKTQMENKPVKMLNEDQKKQVKKDNKTNKKVKEMPKQSKALRSGGRGGVRPWIWRRGEGDAGEPRSIWLARSLPKPKRPDTSAIS